MSRTQFHSIDSFILRHAWLNLWDKRMTTGRINQIAIALRTSFDGFLKRQKTTQKRGTPFGTAGDDLGGWRPQVHPHAITDWCVLRIHRFLWFRVVHVKHTTHQHGPLTDFENNSRWRERPSGARALIVDRSLRLRNNATVTETFLLRAGWLHNQETVGLAAHNFFLAPSRVVSQSRLLNAQSEQPSALAFSGAGIWAVRAYAARSDVEFGFSSSNSTTFPSSEWDTTCRNTTPSTEYFFTSTWLTDLHVARFCGHLRPASTTTVLAHHPTVKASGKRLPAVCVRPPWPTLFEPVDSSNTPIGATSHTRNLTNMDNFETEPTHVRKRLLSFVLPLSLLFMKEQGLRATALFFATNFLLIKTTCTHYMYSLHVLTPHYQVHVLTPCTWTHYIHSLSWYMYLQHRPTVVQILENDIVVHVWLVLLQIDLFSIWTTSTCTTGKSGGLFSSSSSSFRWKIERSKKQSFESSSCVSSSFPFCKKKKIPHKHHEWPYICLVRIWVSTKVQTLFLLSSSTTSVFTYFTIVQVECRRDIATNNGMDWFFFST